MEALLHKIALEVLIALAEVALFQLVSWLRSRAAHAPKVAAVSG